MVHEQAIRRESDVLLSVGIQGVTTYLATS